MKISHLTQCMGFFISLLFCFFSETEATPLPKDMLHIMQQTKYRHSHWGILVKDAKTGEILYDLNSNQLFLPGSTTKLFSVAALLHAYGDDYRFETPVYAVGKIQNGALQGNLILVAQGDLTLGGRQGQSDSIAFTKLDHIYANSIPGAILTKQDPLHGINSLAKQVREKGITQIDGDVLIDDRLFKITEKREMILSPIMLNENLIDLVVNPGNAGEKASLSWRPQVPTYSVTNEIKTVAIGEPLDIQITSDESGKNITIKGTIPLDQKDIVRTFSIKDPNQFTREAFIQALKDQGIVVKINQEKKGELPLKNSFKDMQPVAKWISPPLSEYAKLILKVSHNLGADLVPLLLAVRKGQKTFEEGMLLLGQFVIKEVKLSADDFVFVDAAGGNDNRLSPNAEIQLLHYVKNLPQDRFQKFYNALPIMGVDGSLEDFGRNTDALGRVRAKTGTGMVLNLATDQFFLTTQALAGYIEAKNGRLLEFMIAVNNAETPLIKEVFSVFEDQAQMTAIIYTQEN